MFTFFAFNLERLSEITRPLLLNILSDGTEVEGAHKTCLAQVARVPRLSLLT